MTFTAPLEVDGRPPSVYRPHRGMETHYGGWDRDVQHGRGAGYPLPIPRQHDPPTLDPASPRLTAETVESPLRRDPHGGFGERPGETDRWQHRHRAPGR